MTTETLEQRTKTSYKDVTFEAKALHDRNNKKLLTYDVSLADLKNRGHVRHARPSEVFSLLIANLENKLTPQQEAVADDMLKSYGEWLSAAVERHGDTLTMYTDPQGLVWNGITYFGQDFSFSTKKDFSVQGIPSQEWADLNRFHPDFVKFMYTKPFEQLPKELREGNQRAQVYLPPDGQIWPAGRGSFYGSYDLYCFNFISRASRGVVPSSRAKNQGSPYRTLAKTQKEVLEKSIEKELAVFDGFIGIKNQPEYGQLKQQVTRNLEKLYKK